MSSGWLDRASKVLQTLQARLDSNLHVYITTRRRRQYSYCGIVATKRSHLLYGCRMSHVTLQNEALAKENVRSFIIVDMNHLK
ncbi:hypothetical protein Mapa_009366 [Marchantia paleacea]|nr:hypothetical protein Mapa_009366 [Marchantia paleacea]